MGTVPSVRPMATRGVFGGALGGHLTPFKIEMGKVSRGTKRSAVRFPSAFASGVQMLHVAGPERSRMGSA
jgi:hypothetical protein